MIKDYLNPRNPDKRVLARMSSGKSIVQTLDHPNGDTVVFRYAVALTNANGDAMTNDGVILTAEELKELGFTIMQCAEAGKIRPSAPRAEWESTQPKQQKKNRKYIW